MNWSEITDNPVDARVHIKILEFLKSIRYSTNEKKKEWLIRQIKDKKVLDIGVAEHDLSHMNSQEWKHKYIKENSKYCLGLDIIESLVNELNNRGFDVVHMDATSNEYIGEKFDIVNIGDVIEHVNDPVKLILFAKRHLKENGKIIVSTPNPYFYKHIYRCVRETTFIANFEHTFWITPSMALEISRRSGVSFSGYIFFSSKNKFKAYIQKLLPEIFYGDFTYIFDKNK
jgi:2-polyprenyl-3-methyl-5-hydroxy-6-metoxy-1,4-benzoquinol methylase